MRRRHRRLESNPDLDITAFMNLMIVLVPVLLLSMVFAQTSMIDLNFPEQQSGAANPDSEELQLRVTIDRPYLVLGDNRAGVIEKIAPEAGKPNFERLQTLLKEIKRRFPDKKDIVLLAQPDTDYQTLVTAMDTIRSYKSVLVASVVDAELFPDIALGDAPGAIEQAAGGEAP
ncbi:biopolymer transporter ExbD [Marinobacteraceae bacterium S3BR75-40.1]